MEFPTTNKLIADFIKDINKGPFKCPIDYYGDDTSSFVNIDYKGEDTEAFTDIYDCAVYQAWLDLNRTVKGVAEEHEKAKKAREKASIALRKFFSRERSFANADEFDTVWYYPTMDTVQYEGFLTVGQAQKLLNMSFKYLFCYKELRENKEQHFSHCHIPLDKYTLQWYNEKCRGNGRRISEWSKINDQKLYRCIVKNVRAELAKNSYGENAVIADLIIWSKEKCKAQLIELNNLLKKLKEDDCFCNNFNDADLLVAITELEEKAKQLLLNRKEQCLN